MILEFVAGTEQAIDLPIILDTSTGLPVTGLGLGNFAIDIHDGTGTLVYSRDVGDVTPDTYNTARLTLSITDLGTGAYQLRVTFVTAAVGQLGHATIRETVYGMPILDYGIRVYSGAVAVGASAETYLTAVRTMGISSSDLSDSAVNAIIGEVLYEYSRYRPMFTDRTFDTVADQQKYTPTQMGDSTLVKVAFCIWNPYQTGDEWDLARTLATFGVPREAGYWHMPSQDILEQIKASAWGYSYGGKGFQIDVNGGSLYLTPTPDESGHDVYVQYTKRHSSTTTIPDADRDIFVDLLDWRCSVRMVKEIANKAAAIRVTTPEYQIQAGEKIGLWRAEAKDARQRFFQKIQADGVAAART